MSIFDLPFPEYIKAMEEIVEKEVEDEEISARVVSSLTKAHEVFDKRIKRANYRYKEHAKQWWHFVWKQQYEIVNKEV